MGTSRNAAALAAKMRKLPAAVPAATVTGVVAAGMVIEASVSAASGPYARSRLVRTRTTVRRGANPTAMVRMVSRKAHLLDHDTKPHGRTKGSPGGPGAKSPRTHGKFMWERGVAAGRAAAVDAVGRSIGEAMLKVFR